MTTKVSLVAGTYKDVSASIAQTSINARYVLAKNIGVLIGMTYFYAKVKTEDDRETIDIAYGYNGGFIGMHFGF